MNPSTTSLDRVLAVVSGALAGAAIFGLVWLFYIRRRRAIGAMRSVK